LPRYSCSGRISEGNCRIASKSRSMSVVTIKG
jgi:hypothetical protein